MPEHATLALLFAAAYLVGSLPVAYVLVYFNQEVDLRATGSSNIGAMNAYEVTGSRALGATIALLDALKGAAAVLLPMFIHGLVPSHMFLLRSIALLGVVTGHNYNIWLSASSGRLAGGKGLASAAGGLLLFMAWLVPLWILLYAAGLLLFEMWKGYREIIAGNVFALFLMPLPAYLIYDTQGLFTILLLLLLILPKHIEQVRQLLNAP